MRLVALTAELGRIILGMEGDRKVKATPGGVRARMKRIITLTTDFGLRDGFVGAMKGVILSINPNATIVDISHEIAPQNVEEGAIVFAAAVRYFPADAIHVVVVDPGVGSARRALAVQRGQTIYVAPDNGVLSLALDWRAEVGSWQSDMPSPITAQPSPFHTVELTRAEFWLPRVSSTFHGRDIFAPVAAHLSLGVPLEAVGEPTREMMRLESSMPAQNADGTIVGRVIHVDRFGNLLTNIPVEMLKGKGLAETVVRVADREIRELKRAYAEGARGEAIALISSSGLLEIAVRDGNAAQELRLGVGTILTVR